MYIDMKRFYTILFLGAVIILFQNNAWVKITLVQPALVSLPQHIKNIVVIDRTKQVESLETKLEEVLTGEVFQQDEQAIGRFIEGTLNQCANYGRVAIIRSGEHIVGGGTKNVFPQILQWDQVERYCAKHASDAVLSIEIFDSDFIVTNNPLKVETKDKDGNIIKTTQFKAVGVAVINIGFRLYDPLSKQIIDEYRVTEKLNFNASGNSVKEAVNSLLNKVEAINNVSYQTGISYGKRISPWYYKVTRYFYNKPKKSKYIQQGVRRSEVADWEGAIESWLKVFDSNDKKDKKAVGKAAFNIAVAYEVLGDLEKAKEWARKSYTDYEEKEANDYYKKLQTRIRKENIVKAQLGE